MIKRYTHKSITWIDVESPTREEIRSLMEEYDINPEIAADLHLPSTTSYKEKLIAYKDYLYMVMHFPAFRHSNTGNIDQEVDFIVGKNFIITTRYETIDAFEKFTKTFEVTDMLGKNIMKDHAGYVLYYIIKDMYMSISDELDSINDTLKDIERKIFKGFQKEMVIDLSDASRDLINLKHIVISHKELLKSVAEVGNRIFDKHFSENFEKIITEYYRIENMVMNDIDFLRELRSTNDSLLTSKQNETIKTLTIMAFVTFPLTLISSIFGMNTKYLPFVGADGDFWIVIAIMFVLALSFFLFFKKKKWL